VQVKGNQKFYYKQQHGQQEVGFMKTEHRY
jgi:hypothetical protein